VGIVTDMNLMQTVRLLNSGDFMSPGAVAVSKVRADASASDIAHHTKLDKESSSTDMDQLLWNAKRTAEHFAGRNLEVYEFLSLPKPST